MNGIAHTIRDHINLMVDAHITIVSFPLNSYHPYERLGKIVRKEIYSLCEYDVKVSSHMLQDRIHVFHQMRA